MESNYFGTTNLSKDDVLKVCPLNEYRVLEPKDTVQFLQHIEKPNGSAPAGLISQATTGNKIKQAVMTVSGTLDEFYVTINYLRDDPADATGPAIDQQPLGFAFCSGNALCSGVMVQHGNWQDRTVYYSGVTTSGILTQPAVDAICQVQSIRPPAISGSLDSLNIPGIGGATKIIYADLQRFRP